MWYHTHCPMGHFNAHSCFYPNRLVNLTKIYHMVHASIWDKKELYQTKIIEDHLLRHPCRANCRTILTTCQCLLLAADIMWNVRLHSTRQFTELPSLPDFAEDFLKICKLVHIMITKILNLPDLEETFPIQLYTFLKISLIVEQNLPDFRNSMLAALNLSHIAERKS